MRCPAALAVGLALALGACAQEPPRMPSACTTTDREGYERALAAAGDGSAGEALLPGGVSLSDCARRARTDADLQNLGTTLHSVAEGLAEDARGGDARAARALGYLAAAIAVGAEDSNGISAELARRVENTAVGVRDTGAEVGAAFDEGAAAGRASG